MDRDDGEQQCFYAKIEGKFSVEEMKTLTYSLGYAAGAMVRDKSVINERADMTAELADKIQDCVVFCSEFEDNARLPGSVTFPEYQNLTDEQKKSYLKVSFSAPNEKSVFHKMDFFGNPTGEET